MMCRNPGVVSLYEDSQAAGPWAGLGFGYVTIRTFQRYACLLRGLSVRYTAFLGRSTIFHAWPPLLPLPKSRHAFLKRPNHGPKS